MTFFVLVPLIAAAALLLFTRYHVRRIERSFPVCGTFIDAGGFQLHISHIPGPEDAELPPVVFLHGASGNLRDQMMAFRERLEGRTDLIFIDRPGHGWSQRGDADNGRPDGQARSVAAALDTMGIDRAIIVGHSFGGAIASSMALETPDKVAGLLLISAPTHPWPGGIDWHHHVCAAPLIGPVFSQLLVMPIGLARIDRVARCVFSPNDYPEDYLEVSGTELVLRPRAFRNNAVDVVNLYDHVVRTEPRYQTIATPTVIITGNRDDVVSPDIHSEAMAREVPGSHLLRIRGVGHKPDFAATDLCIAAMQKIAGENVDLDAMVVDLESRLEGQQQGSHQAGPNPGRADQIPVMPSDPI